MKSPSSLLTGSLVFTLFYLLNFVTRFGTSVIVARSLGVEGKGMYTLIILASTVVFLLVNPGIHTALVFFTSHGRYSTASLIGFCFYLVMGISLVGGVMLFGLFNLGLFNSLLLDVPAIHMLLVLVSVPINLWILFLSSILLGRQLILEFNIVESLRLASNLGFQGLSAWLGAGLNGALVCWLAANGIAFLATLWFLRKEICKPLQFPTSVLKPVISYGIHSYPVSLLNFINTRIDTFLVNIFAGSSQVGLYTTSASLAEMLWFVPNAFGNTVFSKIPTLDHSEANDLTARACRQTILVMIFLLVVAAFSAPILIPWFYGPEFTPAGLPFLWLLPGIFGLGITRVLAADFNGRGKPQFVTLTTLISAILTIVLDLALIPQFGMLGAAVTSSIAYLTSTILLVTWSKLQNNQDIKSLLVPTRQDVIEIISFGKYLAARIFRRKAFNKG